MEAVLTKDLTILPSICDSSAALSVPDTFALFMDIATEHARDLGCGLDALGTQGLFWLAVRTRVRFYRRPKMLERVTLTSWPAPPGKLRADRSYTLRRGDERLIDGKTEWTILDQNTGRLHPMAGVFSPDIAFRAEPVWDEPFTRMRDEELPEFARYTVRSTDIDLGAHMNNAAYVRALAGSFSGEAWQGMDVRELEIAYRAPCYEGDTLVWQKREEEDGALALRAALPDGKTIVLARLLTG